MQVPHGLGQVHLVCDELVESAPVSVGTAQVSDVAVDVVHLGGASLGEVLVHGGPVQGVAGGGHEVDLLDGLLTRLDQLDPGTFTGVVGLVEQHACHVLLTREGREVTHRHVEHRAQRVDHGVEHDLRHEGAHEVLLEHGVEVRGLEVCEDGAGHVIGPLGEVDHVHLPGAGSADEVNVTGAVEDGGDHGGPPDDVFVGEVLLKLLDVAHAVHRGEHVLLGPEEVCAAGQDVLGLHLLEEDDPHVGVARVVLRGRDRDGNEVSSHVVTGHEHPTLFTNGPDIGLPGVDEVDLDVGVLAEEDTVAVSHGSGTDDCVLHCPDPSWFDVCGPGFRSCWGGNSRASVTGLRAACPVGVLRRAVGVWAGGVSPGCLMGVPDATRAPVGRAPTSLMVIPIVSQGTSPATTRAAPFPEATHTAPPEVTRRHPGGAQTREVGPTIRETPHVSSSLRDSARTRGTRGVGT